MNGEYLLSLDPYNFDTEEEYVKFYHPDLWEEIEMERLEKELEELNEKELQNFKL